MKMKKTTSAAEIKRYMRQEIADHIDPLTGEVNMTSLAEDAQMHFDIPLNSELEEDTFEWAFEISEVYEKKMAL